MPGGPDDFEHLPGLEPDEPGPSESTGDTENSMDTSSGGTSDPGPSELYRPNIPGDGEPYDPAPSPPEATRSERNLQAGEATTLIPGGMDDTDWEAIADLPIHTEEAHRFNFPAMRNNLVYTLVLVGGAAALVGLSAWVYFDEGPDNNGPAVVQEAPAVASQIVEAPSGDAEPSTATEELTPEEVALAADLAATPEGFQLDTYGMEPDTGDDEETGVLGEDLPEPPAVGPIAKAAAIKYTAADKGSYIFSMIVEGDGETLSQSDEGFYEISFTVNNKWPDNFFYDDTGFVVRVEWNKQAQKFTAVARNQQGERLNSDADATIEWLDSSTLQVTLKLPDHDVELVEVRTEVFAYLVDDSGNFVYRHRDIAIWTAKP